MNNPNVNVRAMIAIPLLMSGAFFCIGLWELKDFIKVWPDAYSFYHGAIASTCFIVSLILVYIDFKILDNILDEHYRLGYTTAVNWIQDTKAGS